MSSGKQVSFAYGEVSPSLRFRVDANFYAQALGKLENAFVRKSGGVSNRPGMRHVIASGFQQNIPQGSFPRPGVRVFPYTAPNDSRFLIYVRDRIDGAPDGWDFDVDGPWTPNNVVRIQRLNGSNPPDNIQPPAADFVNNTYNDVLINLQKAQIAYEGNLIRIYFNDGNVLRINRTNDTTFNASYTNVADTAPGFLGAAATLSFYWGFTNTGPVSYLITQELWSGEEVGWAQLNLAVGHPNASQALAFISDIGYPQVGNRVKQYNIYRATTSVDPSNVANVVATSLFFGRVGVILPGGAAVFVDYGVTPDFTAQPPLDARLYTSINRRVFHRERAINVITPNELFDQGTLVVSKLGAPNMLLRPLISNPTDAFTFTIPVSKLNRITNIIAANRVLVFTEQNAFLIRGGDGGVLQPLEVNPQSIAEEGCSDSVNPVALGSRVFFLTYNRTKLMAVDFIRDDQVEVSDISTIAEHLFEPRDIVDMATTAGAVNILWMLKRDGTLISLSLSEEGVVGYATHKTSGFIESICSQLDEPDYVNGVQQSLPPSLELVPSLFMTVIRFGVRYVERLSYREDINLPAQMYADGAIFFGRSLPLETREFFSYPRYLLSTQIGVPFEAGQVVNLQNLDSGDFTVSLAGDIIDHTRIDFFFQGFDFEGNLVRQSVRFIPTNVVDASNVEGYFEEDPPLSLDAVPTRDWVTATDRIPNLNQFIGRGFLSVYADGEVLSSPLNPNRDDALMVNGSGQLPLPKFVREAVIGYPYETTIETLDLETADARTFTDVGKLITSVGLGLYRTKGGFVGQSGKPLTSMEEYLIREDESLEEPTREISGHIVVQFPAGWEKTGRVSIKQVDPLPMSVLAVYPRGMIGE